MDTHVFKPDQPAPALSVGPLGWLRANLFSGGFNTLLTLLGLYLVWQIVPPLIDWAFIEADWRGETRADCSREGACWVFVGERFGQFMYGFYPQDQRWRVDLTVLLAVVGAAPLFVAAFRHKLRYGLAFLLVYPLLAWWLLHGGFLGLIAVPTSQWGGLMLTLVIAAVGIAGALPLGILLALGRRSDLPAIKVLCVTFIEFWRGVPLITVLFMSSVMLPLFLPNGVSIDKLLRAQIAFIMFAAAYMAEAIRGGLQAIPKGQYEAGDALGLHRSRTMMLIVLPQLVRIALPGLGNVWQLTLKDTALVSVTALAELMRVTHLAAGATRQPFLFYATAAVLYLLLTSISTALFNRAEIFANRGVRRA